MKTSLKNSNGRSRGYSENRIILLALAATMHRHLSEKDIQDVNWTSMENEVAQDLCLSSLYVKELRKALFQEDMEEKEDCYVVISFGEEKNRGGAADGRKDLVSLKIDSTVL